MKFNILTPFSRKQNMKYLLDNLRDTGVTLYPIIEMKKGMENDIEFPLEDWIKPFHYVVPDGFDRGREGLHVCQYSLNLFIESGLINDDEYYITMADDDFVEPGFFEKLKGIDTDFIVTSVKRGDNVTAKGYGTDTLIGAPENMQLYKISGEQVIFKGKVLKENRFVMDPCADGIMIEKMWYEHPHENFTFVPDAYFWFNYLEDGRWNNFKRE